MNPRVLQIRTDALVAEYLYKIKLEKIGWLSITINTLTIIVPTLFSAALLITKGTQYEFKVNVFSIVISYILLALSVFSLILRVEQNRENYLIGRRNNIYISNEALKLLNKKDEELDWFYNYLVEMDSKDQENLNSISKKLQQEAYRYSLKKQIPGQSNVVCSICNASPFKFKKSCIFPHKTTCETCGNLP